MSLSYKKCQNCNKFGHKGSHCRNRKIIKNRVRHTKSEDESDKVVRKYITVKVLDKSVRFQLDFGSDLSMIYLQTWRKLHRPIIKMTSKTARTVTGDKIKFEGEIIIPVSLNGITKKLGFFARVSNLASSFASWCMNDFLCEYVISNARWSVDVWINWDFLHECVISKPISPIDIWINWDFLVSMKSRIVVRQLIYESIGIFWWVRHLESSFASWCTDQLRFFRIHVISNPF